MPDTSRPPFFEANLRALSVGDNFSTGQFGTPGAANVKGAWSELIASTALEAEGFWIFFTNSTGSPFHALLDIGIGASGSEQVVLPNLYVYAHSNDRLAQGCFIPLKIPRGSRVCSRWQSSTGGGALYGQIELMVGSQWAPPGFEYCHTLGPDTASSMSTISHTPDYGVGWTQVSSNSPECRGLVASFQQIGVGATAHQIFFDLAYGPNAAGTPTDLIVGGIPAYVGVNLPSASNMQHIPFHIPAGSSVWVRANSAGYAGPTFRTAIYGFQ